MSRYIDADMIDKKVSDAYDTWTDDTAEHVVARNLLKSIRKFLLELPSIDIVRCAECKNSIASVDNSLCCRRWYDNLGFWEEVKADDFCSYGERRTDD